MSDLNLDIDDDTIRLNFNILSQDKATILSGEIPPTEKMGKNNNFYVDIKNKKLYIKIEGSWYELL